jgi:SPP1 gp7 family putative phage head morphogenesis protein
MDESQAFAAIRNAIRLESLGRRTAAKVTPDLVAAFKEVRRAVELMPTGTIEREMYYKRMLQQLVPLFRGANNTFYQSLSQSLREEVEEQVEWATKFLGEDVKPVGVATGATPSGQPFVSAGSGITRTQIYALVDETEVLGNRLGELFEWDLDKGSPYVAAQIKKIDRVIKQGFLLGHTNEEIARNLLKASNGAIRDTRALARTGVMDMSQRAHERFWDANSDRIVLWEYDATFDYRVCPQCYPYEGKRAKKRKDLPTVPVHPNCRCRVLPVTATALALEKEELGEGMEMSIVEINENARDASGRIYKTPGRLNGKNAVKSAREIQLKKGVRPTMGQFIAKTTPDTREAILGRVRAREFEYITSSNRGAKRKSVEDALRFVTNGDANSFAKAQRARNRRR